MSPIAWMLIGAVFGGFAVWWLLHFPGPLPFTLPELVSAGPEPAGEAYRLVVRWPSGMESAFIGSGTVWHNERTGGRAGTTLEAWLTDRAWAWDRGQRTTPEAR